MDLLLLAIRITYASRNTYDLIMSLVFGRVSRIQDRRLEVLDHLKVVLKRKNHKLMDSGRYICSYSLDGDGLEPFHLPFPCRDLRSSSSFTTW